MRYLNVLYGIAAKGPDALVLFGLTSRMHSIKTPVLFQPMPRAKEIQVLTLDAFHLPKIL